MVVTSEEYDPEMPGGRLIERPPTDYEIWKEEQAQKEQAKIDATQAIEDARIAYNQRWGRTDAEIADDARAQAAADKAQWEEDNALYEEQQASIASGALIPGTITTSTYADPDIQSEFDPSVVPLSVEERTVYYTKPPDPYTIEDIQEFREYGGGLYMTGDYDVSGPVQAIDAFEEEVEQWDEEDIQEYRKAVIQQQRQKAYEDRKWADYSGTPDPLSGGDLARPEFSDILTTHVLSDEILREREYAPQGVIAQDLGELAFSSDDHQAHLAAKMAWIAEGGSGPMSESDLMEIREFGERDFYDPTTGEFPHSEMWEGLERSDEYGLLGGTTQPSLSWAGNPLEWAKRRQEIEQQKVDSWALQRETEGELPKYGPQMYGPYSEVGRDYSQLAIDADLKSFLETEISDDFYMDKSFTEYGTSIDYDFDVAKPLEFFKQPSLGWSSFLTPLGLFSAAEMVSRMEIDVRRGPTRIDDFDPKYVSGAEQLPDYLSNYQRMIDIQQSKKTKITDPIERGARRWIGDFTESFGIKPKTVDRTEYGVPIETTGQYFDLTAILPENLTMPFFGKVSQQIDINTDPLLFDLHDIDNLTTPFFGKIPKSTKIDQFAHLEDIETAVVIPATLGAWGVSGVGKMVAGGLWDIGTIAYSPIFQERDFSDIVYKEDLHWVEKTTQIEDLESDRTEYGEGKEIVPQFETEWVHMVAGQEKEILDEYGETKIVDWDFGVETAKERYGSAGKLPVAGERYVDTGEMDAWFEQGEFDYSKIPTDAGKWQSDLGKDIINYERRQTKETVMLPFVSEAYEAMEEAHAEDPLKFWGEFGGQLIFFTTGLAALSKVPIIGRAATRPIVWTVQPFEEVFRVGLESIPGLKKAWGGTIDTEEVVARAMRNILDDYKTRKADRFFDVAVYEGYKDAYWKKGKKLRAEKKVRPEDTIKADLADIADLEIDKIPMRWQEEFKYENELKDIRDLTQDSWRHVQSDGPIQDLTFENWKYAQEGIYPTEIKELFIDPQYDLKYAGDAEYFRSSIDTDIEQDIKELFIDPEYRVPPLKYAGEAEYFRSSVDTDIEQDVDQMLEDGIYEEGRFFTAELEGVEVEYTIDSEGKRRIRRYRIEGEWDYEYDFEGLELELDRELDREFEREREPETEREPEREREREKGEREREREREPEREREREKEKEREREKEKEPETEWEIQNPDWDFDDFDDFGYGRKRRRGGYVMADIYNPVVRDIDKAIDDMLKDI